MQREISCSDLLFRPDDEKENRSIKFVVVHFRHESFNRLRINSNPFESFQSCGRLKRNVDVQFVTDSFGRENFASARSLAPHGSSGRRRGRPMEKHLD